MSCMEPPPPEGSRPCRPSVSVNPLTEVIDSQVGSLVGWIVSTNKLQGQRKPTKKILPELPANPELDNMLDCLSSEGKGAGTGTFTMVVNNKLRRSLWIHIKDAIKTFKDYWVSYLVSILTFERYVSGRVYPSGSYSICAKCRYAASMGFYDIEKHINIGEHKIKHKDCNHKYVMVTYD